MAKILVNLETPAVFLFLAAFRRGTKSEIFEIRACNFRVCACAAESIPHSPATGTRCAKILAKYDFFPAENSPHLHNQRIATENKKFAESGVSAGNRACRRF